MKKTLTLLCALGCFTGIASAATLVTSADSYIYGGSQDSNFGTSDWLYANDGGGVVANVQKIYMKFDASSLPTLASISGLTMRYDASTNRTGNFYLLEGTGADSWTETGITWNNAPLNNDTGFDFTAGSGQTITSLGAIAGNGQFQPITLTFGTAEETALLNALNTGDRIATIGILHSGTNFFQIAALDAGASIAPTLEYTAIPEPTTAALLGLAAAGAVLLRRRRKAA